MKVVRIYKYYIKGYAPNPTVEGARFTYDMTMDSDSTLNCASFPQMLIRLAIKTKEDQGQLVDPNSIVIEKLELRGTEQISESDWNLQKG